MKATIPFAAIAAFILLHHDSWLWNDSRLVFGFLPAGLAYHAGYSIATAGLWAAVSRFAWTEDERLSPSEPTADSLEGRAR